MSDAIIDAIQNEQLKADRPDVTIGDTVDVHVRIVEGAKERIQVFRGVVIAMKGKGLEKMVTVRRIVANEGVERVFPVHSPRVSKIEVLRHGKARRAKLYYLRERVGKRRRLADRRRGLNRRSEEAGVQAVAEAEADAAASGAEQEEQAVQP